RHADRLVRNNRVRNSDLFRLFRLYGHGHRHGPTAGFPFSGEFPAAVPRIEHHRFLAALAHFALALAPRLSLYSTWRQPPRASAHVSQSDADNAARRAVARRQLELCCLGRLSWGAAERGTDAGIQEASGPEPLERLLSTTSGSDVRAGDDRLGFLSRRD